MTMKLTVKNFKCFLDTSTDLKKLNVLCGKNGVGKSSFIQALLLVRAAALAAKKRQSRVALNGEYGLSLGQYSDMLHQSGQVATTFNGAIEISLESETLNLSFIFDADSATDNDYSAAFTETTSGEIFSDPWSLVYLSAERNGPRLAQEQRSNLPVEQLVLGEYGEYTAEVLNNFERSTIDERMLHPSELEKPVEQRNMRLLHNVQQWISSIFGLTQMRLEPNGRLSPPSILFKNQSAESDWVLATNYGFGVSYSLPIIVAGLKIPSDGILIVDSPEAHLHPAAQVILAQFLCLVAARGCTVILETHSDHIVDGIRLAIAEKAGNISHEDCSFLSFENREAVGVVACPIPINPNGTLEFWPSGFFDQKTLTLRALARRAKE